MHVSITGVLGDEHVHGPRSLACGSAPALDGPYCTRDRLVQNDEVGCRYIEAFLAHGGGDEYVDLAASETIELGQLLLLRHALLCASR